MVRQGTVAPSPLASDTLPAPVNQFDSSGHVLGRKRACSSLGVFRAPLGGYQTQAVGKLRSFGVFLPGFRYGFTPDLD